jgi:hypothetical protein
MLPGDWHVTMLEAMAMEVVGVDKPGAAEDIPRLLCYRASTIEKSIRLPLRVLYIHKLMPHPNLRC